MHTQHFAARDVQEVMQTIVHEMTHMWQYNFGVKHSEKSYNDKEWADKIEALGLMPSDTGRPGGKKTGQNMGDYAIEGGLFLQSCERLLTPDFKISWRDKFTVSDTGLTLTITVMGLPTKEGEDITVKPGNKSLRVKYSCMKCKINIWGKPGLNVVCGECGTRFQARTRAVPRHKKRRGMKPSSVPRAGSASGVFWWTCKRATITGGEFASGA